MAEVEPAADGLRADGQVQAARVLLPDRDQPADGLRGAVPAEDHRHPREDRRSRHAQFRGAVEAVSVPAGARLLRPALRPRRRPARPRAGHAARRRRHPLLPRLDAGLDVALARRIARGAARGVADPLPDLPHRLELRLPRLQLRGLRRRAAGALARARRRRRDTLLHARRLRHPLLHRGAERRRWRRQRRRSRAARHGRVRAHPQPRVRRNRRLRRRRPRLHRRAAVPDACRAARRPRHVDARPRAPLPAPRVYNTAPSSSGGSWSS